MSDRGFSFDVEHSLASGPGRAGVIRTPHGDIRTPAFTPVGTKATVKAVLPETMRELGGQVILANAYHLYLQPGADIVDEAGGLAAFMGWHGPTITDSGGFQVLSLGVGFKKILAMDARSVRSDDVIAEGKDRLAHVDDDGVTFKSHLDGSMHRFTPEVSMQVQHQIGADIMFAFDECTTLLNTREYQERSVARTQGWAERCVAEHERLTVAACPSPVPGAVRRWSRARSTRTCAGSPRAGSRRCPWTASGSAGRWRRTGSARSSAGSCEELPEGKPRHLLGIGTPDDVFAAVEAGADTFDCVAPSRNARNGTVYHPTKSFHLTNGLYKRDFTPIDDTCDCYTCAHYTRAYVHHLFKAKEMVASTLATIHNERYIVRLIDRIRASIIDGTFDDLREDVLGREARG